MTAYGLHDYLELDSAYWAYRLWLRDTYPAFQLGAGTYPINQDLSVGDLFGEVLLYEPQADDVAITILPGWHVQEVEDYLNAEFRSQNSEFLIVGNAELLTAMKNKYGFLT